MAVPKIVYPVTFNGWSFDNIPGLQVYNVNPYVLGHRDLNIFPLARSSVRKLSSAFYDSRVVSVSLWINASSRAALDQALDTLFANIQAQEGTLVIPQGNTFRQYTATFSSHIHNSPATGASTIPAPKGGNIDLTLNFDCSDSLGYDQFFTPMIGPISSTASPNQWNWTFIGGADQQLPFLQFYFTGGTLGSGTVTIGNLNTGQAVAVTRTWSVGDTLQIDVKNNTVRVNGVDVAFTGAIPTFGLGLQTITYFDNLSSRTYQFYSYIYQRWN